MHRLLHCWRDARTLLFGHAMVCLRSSLRKFSIKRVKYSTGNEKVLESEIKPIQTKLMQNVLSTDEVVNPTSVILFPDQGTQYVGMGSKLSKFPKAKRIFEMANEVLGYNLLRLCLEGPKDILNRTQYAQPAVMISSLAALEQLKEEHPKAIDSCVATAGFSLGELTALVFAGVIPFDKGLELVQVRANAMQMACDKVSGAMAMVLCAHDTEIRPACVKAQQWCIDKGIKKTFCGVANYMYPHCKVIAGNLEAIDFLENNYKAFKMRRIERLAVDGAFHTPLMNYAVDPFVSALSKIILEEPRIRVYANVDGKPYKSVAHIKTQLAKQMVRPVKWEQTMQEMNVLKKGVGFPRTFECGPGKGLISILQQFNAKAANTAYHIEA